jgi:hypothetical protein
MMENGATEMSAGAPTAPRAAERRANSDRQRRTGRSRSIFLVSRRRWREWSGRASLLFTRPSRLDGKCCDLENNPVRRQSSYLGLVAGNILCDC